MDFVNTARLHGVLIDRLYADGKIHRVRTVRHPRHKNGAYVFDGEWGWFQDWSEHVEPIIYKDDKSPWEPHKRPRSLPKVDLAKQYAEASARAAEIIAAGDFYNHPYLDKKGFQKEQGLVDFDGRLMIPMRDMHDYRRINSIQWIDKDGNKKFMPGGKAKGSIFTIGPSVPEKWLVEGYCTGLSVRAALARMYRNAQVVVCFSAGNLQHVAQHFKGYVVADNDASGTGERVARATGLPWCMPPTVGHDANDMHISGGVNVLSAMLRGALRT